MSDSSRPHGLQRTRLLCPWDFPGKSTGVGCHCLLPRTSYTGKMKEMTRMGMHSWFEGQGAWNGGLMQRRNVPKKLILVDFQEVTTCPTCVEKSKHCVGSKCPGKQSSGVPYRPASAFWALSKHALTSQSEGPLCLQLQQLLPTWSLSLEPTLLLLLSFLLSISGMAPLP